MKALPLFFLAFIWALAAAVLPSEWLVFAIGCSNSWAVAGAIVIALEPPPAIATLTLRNHPAEPQQSQERAP